MNTINTLSQGFIPLDNQASSDVSHQAVAATNVVSNTILATMPKPSNVSQFNEPTKETVANAAKRIQDFVKSMGISLNFSVDSTTGYHVVTVVDPSSGEIIRQLPSPELLKIAKSMDQLKNSLVSQTA